MTAEPALARRLEHPPLVARRCYERVATWAERQYLAAPEGAIGGIALAAVSAHSPGAGLGQKAQRSTAPQHKRVRLLAPTAG